MNIHEDAHASYKLLARELHQKGYTLEEFTLGGRLVVSFSNDEGRRWTTKAEAIAYPMNSSFIADVSKNKHLGYEFAARENISIPETVMIGPDETEEAARELLEQVGTVIVKPNTASLSNGFTRNITTVEALQRAVTAARAYGDAVLVQQQITGEEVRFVVLNGRVKAAAIRQAAQVVGDGVSSIEQLIKRENSERANLTNMMVTYPQLDRTILPERILKSERVPADGEVVKLHTSTMIRGGASIYSVLDDIDPSHIADVERLTKKLGAGFLVVDMFLGDYKQPSDETTTYFMEFNTAPVLKLFYSCRDGNHIVIVPPLAATIDRILEAEV